MTQETLTIAVPKGRILKEFMPLFDAVGLQPEDDFFDSASRKLMFDTNINHIRIIRVRSFDVPTFVQHGAAQLGIAGSDVLDELNYPDIYNRVDLGIGKCRLSLACKASSAITTENITASHMRVATKYPNLTKAYFAQLGVQAECIKLNGAMELAPALGLAPYIVDLVSTGSTLKANALKELTVIREISSRLIINRTAFKVRQAEITNWIDKFEAAIK